jgi:hypothetical protein
LNQQPEDRLLETRCGIGVNFLALFAICFALLRSAVSAAGGWAMDAARFPEDIFCQRQNTVGCSPHSSRPSAEERHLVHQMPPKNLDLLFYDIPSFMALW